MSAIVSTNYWSESIIFVNERTISLCESWVETGFRRYLMNPWYNPM